MSKRVSLLLFVAVFVMSGFTSPSAAGLDAPEPIGFDAAQRGQGRLPKVDVCHITGNGKYVFININEHALPAHLAHGDSLPGEDGLDANCAAPTVEFVDISVGFFGEGLVINWTVDGTSDPVTYYVEGIYFDGANIWEPIVPFANSVVPGIGQGSYSALDVFFFDEYRVRAVDGDGNEVISPTVSPF